jgi:hypothetical protein
MKSVIGFLQCNYLSWGQTVMAFLLRLQFSPFINWEKYKKNYRPKCIILMWTRLLDSIPPKSPVIMLKIDPH